MYLVCSFDHSFSWDCVAPYHTSVAQRIWNMESLVLQYISESMVLWRTWSARQLEGFCFVRHCTATNCGTVSSTKKQRKWYGLSQIMTCNGESLRGHSIFAHQLVAFTEPHYILVQELCPIRRWLAAQKPYGSIQDWSSTSRRNTARKSINRGHYIWPTTVAISWKFRGYGRRFKHFSNFKYFL